MPSSSYSFHLPTSPRHSFVLLGAPTHRLVEGPTHRVPAQHMGIGRALGECFGKCLVPLIYVCLKAYHVCSHLVVLSHLLPTRVSLAPVQGTMRGPDHCFLPHLPPLPSLNRRRALIHEQLCPLDRNAKILSYHTKSTISHQPWTPSSNSEVAVNSNKTLFSTNSSDGTKSSDVDLTKEEAEGVIAGSLFGSILGR